MQETSNNTIPAGNLQPDLYASIITTLTLAVVAVALRFLSRRLVKARLWLDDWLSLTALVMAIGLDIDIIIMNLNGTGLHIQAINRDRAKVYQDFFMGLWVGNLFYSFALTAAKLAFLAFYRRIFQVPSIKLPTTILAVLVICWLITLITIFHCSPIQGYWDKTIPATCNVDEQKFFVDTVAAHLVIDLLILALPVPYIKDLRISIYQKLCIFSLFLFGGFICFATILQIITCIRLDQTSPDVTYNFAPIGIWASAEVNLAVMASCLPSLRPIWCLLTTGSLKSLQGSKQSVKTGTGNGTKALNSFKNPISESTIELTDTNGYRSKSLTEAQADMSSRGNEPMYETENTVLGQTHQMRDGITVKDEVYINISGSTH